MVGAPIHGKVIPVDIIATVESQCFLILWSENQHTTGQVCSLRTLSKHNVILGPDVVCKFFNLGVFMARKTQCDETCEGCPVPDKVCDRFYDCPRTAAKAIAPYIKVVKKPVKQQAKVATCPMQTTTCEWGVLDIRCTAKRVFNRFCELRGALGSGITQQTKPAITPPTSGGKEYGTGG